MAQRYGMTDEYKLPATDEDELIKRYGPLKGSIIWDYELLDRATREEAQQRVKQWELIDKTNREEVERNRESLTAANRLLGSPAPTPLPQDPNIFRRHLNPGDERILETKQPDESWVDMSKRLARAATGAALGYGLMGPITAATMALPIMGNDYLNLQKLKKTVGIAEARHIDSPNEMRKMTHSEAAKLSQIKNTRAWGGKRGKSRRKKNRTHKTRKKSKRYKRTKRKSRKSSNSKRIKRIK